MSSDCDPHFRGRVILQAVSTLRRTGRRWNVRESVGGWSKLDQACLFCGCTPASWTASQQTWATALCGGLRSTAQEHTAAWSHKRLRSCPRWEHCMSFQRQGTRSWCCSAVRKRRGSQSNTGKRDLEARLLLWDLVKLERDAVSLSGLVQSVGVAQVGQELLIVDMSATAPRSVVVNCGNVSHLRPRRGLERRCTMRRGCRELLCRCWLS